MEKIHKLQQQVQEKDLLQEQTQQQLREARNELLLVRCSNAKSANGLPYEVLYNTFKYLPAMDLCVVSCVNRYWHAVASVNTLWRDEFARRFGAVSMQASLDNTSAKLKQSDHSPWVEVSADGICIHDPLCLFRR